MVRTRLLNSSSTRGVCLVPGMHGMACTCCTGRQVPTLIRACWCMQQKAQSLALTTGCAIALARKRLIRIQQNAQDRKSMQSKMHRTEKEGLRHPRKEDQPHQLSSPAKAKALERACECFLRNCPKHVLDHRLLAGLCCCASQQNDIFSFT